MKISVNNLTKIFDESAIFDDCSFEIVMGQKVALVGENGSGKSTLLKILAGLENYQEGDIFIPKGIKVGYLKQEFDKYEDTVYDYIYEEFKSLQRLERQMDEAAKKLASSLNLDSDMDRYARLQEEFETMGGYTIDNKIERIASGLKIEEYLQEPYVNLSGGQKTRVELVRLLVSKSDVLCLDEPTNHLDFLGIKWLEDYCKSLDKTIVVVSHDRTFLNNVVNIYHEIEDGQVITYHGNFASFREQKRKRFEHLVNNYNIQQEEIKRIQTAIRRYRQWGHESDNPDFFKKAKTLEKRLNRINKLPKPEELENRLNLSFEVKERSGKDVLTIEDLAIGYDDILQCELNLKFKYQERWAIIGENGSGKSTLIKTILNEIKPITGKVHLGSRVHIGYLAQQFVYQNDNGRILDYVISELNVSEFVARQSLAQFAFYQNDVFKTIKQLSGGEKIRLRLMIMMKLNINFIILDEPTNHLDIQSCEILESVLKNYEGTLLLVSHDRYFLEALNTQNFYLE